MAVVFFVVDVHAAGLGIWSVAGVVTLVGGSLLLFAGASEALQLELWVVAAALFGTLVFFISVMTAALRVRLRRPITGQEGIIGQIAEARTDIAPEGTVFTGGTLWRARTMETGIAAGSKVEVKATEGLVLLVEPLHEQPVD
jgi:membrane-bound serine protease (ClpP class)